MCDFVTPLRYGLVRRLIARAITKGTHDAIGDFLSDGDKRVWQLACNIPRGVHKAFVGVTKMLRNHPEWLAVTGDVRRVQLDLLGGRG